MTGLISQITFHQIKKKERFVISSISGLVSTIGLNTILKKNAVYCFTCFKAQREKVVQHNLQFKSYLLYDGFTRWNKAVEKLSQHENSSMHEESTEKFTLLQQTPVYLARQGLALRSHDDISGNFDQLLYLRANDIPELQYFLKNKKNFVSWDIQNETKAASNRCQSAQEQQKKYFWVYETYDVTGERLFAVIEDVLGRFNLSFKDLRGKCYDGGSNISGAVKEVQKSSQGTILPLCESLTKSCALGLCSKYLSTERMHAFSDLAVDLYPKETHDPKPLCSTSWTVRVKSITSVINYNPAILQFFNEDVASKARGLYDQFCNREVYLGLRICLGLFSETECCCVAKENNDGEKGNEYGFNHLWFEMDSKVIEYELILPTLPRSKKIPKRLQQSNYAFASPEELYRKAYFEALDSITGEIQRRFEQTRYKNMLTLKRHLQLSQ
ncbi:hypothetical protein PR048_031270 [Dryococelus australis]|uniref:Uncharacterized protein n=1 Tax=Dryococelus australis TaxID=614101 RepID=A0ABQ9G5I2_9NEOP|nr:hypothetical protein PR048_031270 [Dryococelus australis]